jgi:hypothetical protein
MLLAGLVTRLATRRHLVQHAVRLLGRQVSGFDPAQDG